MVLIPANQALEDRHDSAILSHFQSCLVMANRVKFESRLCHGRALAAVSYVSPTLTLMGMPFNPMSTLDRLGDDYFMHDRSTRVAVIRPMKLDRFNTTVWRVLTPDEKFIGFFPTLEIAATLTWELWVLKGRPHGR